MELHQLEYLRAIVRTGSVTGAAALVSVSQPSVSKQIKLLEREIGTPLLTRVGRTVVPTEAGVALAACAERIFDDLAATADGIAQLASSLRGSLRLCATETLTDHLLPPALAALRRQRPGVQVSVEMLGTDAVVEEVLAGRADLGFVVLPLADSRLAIVEQLEEEILLAVPSGDGWAAGGTVDVADALTRPDLLLSMPGHGLRAQLEREAQVRGIALRSGLDLRSQQALLAMVACGAGVTFVPRMSAVPRDGVAILALVPRLTRRVGWIARRGRRLSPVASLFIEMLERCVADAEPVYDRA